MHCYRRDPRHGPLDAWKTLRGAGIGTSRSVKLARLVLSPTLAIVGTGHRYIKRAEICPFHGMARS